MKKLLSILLATLMLFSSFAVVSFAAGYEQPYPEWTAGSQYYRIPALYTLNDGSVIAAADLRYSHASDSPQNLDTVISISKDGYKDWEWQSINHFYDYADTENFENTKNSASFIDPAVVQDSKGRIYVVVDAFPSGGGAPNAQKGTGYITVDGKKHLALTDGDYKADISTFGYYIGDFAGALAPVYKKDGTVSAYAVDKEFNLYKNGAPLLMEQNYTGKLVPQNIFYVESDLTVYFTMYQWLRYSDDMGKTWSDPQILSSQIKSDDEGFFGFAPGRGTVTTVNGKERIIFPVYNSPWLGTVENCFVVYSDDAGATWQRSKIPVYTNAIGVQKTSEAQIITLPDGTLRMYARTMANYAAYTESKDGGETWSYFTVDKNLECTSNCMMSFINTNIVIDGKPVIAASFASDINARGNGKICLGTIEADNSVKWISDYHINDGFFAYSCLTQLSDGNIAILGEEGMNGLLVYRVFSVDENGELTDVSGDKEKVPELSFGEKIKEFFKRLINKIMALFGLI